MMMNDLGGLRESWRAREQDGEQSETAIISRAQNYFYSYFLFPKAWLSVVGPTQNFTPDCLETSVAPGSSLSLLYSEPTDTTLCAVSRVARSQYCMPCSEYLVFFKVGRFWCLSSSLCDV